MDAQEIWIIGTEPPCPRCDYLTRMVKDVVSDLGLPVSVRHLNYKGEEARRFATTYGLEPGTAKDVARKLSIGVDWGKVHAIIGDLDHADSASCKESCCSTIASRWSPELDELLRPCETKSHDAGIMMTPVLVVGGRCVHQGSVPSRGQVEQWTSELRDGLSGIDQAPYNRVIEVLGPGCSKCDRLYDNVLDALAHADLQESVTVKKRTDLAYFEKMGVTVTPALVIDGQVQSKGRVLTADQIVELLQKGAG
jgi:hypothetical protein